MFGWHGTTTGGTITENMRESTALFADDPEIVSLGNRFLSSTTRRRRRGRVQLPRSRKTARPGRPCRVIHHGCARVVQTPKLICSKGGAPTLSAVTGSLVVHSGFPVCLATIAPPLGGSIVRLSYRRGVVTGGTGGSSFGMLFRGITHVKLLGFTDRVCIAVVEIVTN